MSTENEKIINVQVNPLQSPQPVNNIPLFLKKLWRMVNDKNAEDIIGWNTSGDGFVIFDQIRFISELLPLYFKHNNLASFVRQLNFYDFHKVANTYKSEIEFAHPYFLKDLPDTLPFITRKCPNIKTKSAGVKEEDINQLFQGVKDLKSKHHMVDAELKCLKQENATLWNEINALRIKYSKQTQIINKLIHFLISYIHSHQNNFSKQGVSVTRNRCEPKVIESSPKLLQIDYRNRARKQSFSSSDGEAKATIESLLEDSTNDEAFDTYTVSYPGKKKVGNTKYPIEEILTDIDPFLEESSSYTVKFPKKKSAVKKTSSVKKSSPIVDPPAKKRGVKHQLVANIPVQAKVAKVEPATSQSFINKPNGVKQITPIAVVSLEKPSALSPLQPSPIVTSPAEPSPVSESTDVEEPAFGQVDNAQEIQFVPEAQPDKSKWNIMENPKQNLGVYLDNTQLELNNLQQILNEINSKELFGTCFNVEAEPNNDEGLPEHLRMITKELEDELSKLPAESDGGDGDKKVINDNVAIADVDAALGSSKGDASFNLDEYFNFQVE